MANYIVVGLVAAGWIALDAAAILAYVAWRGRIKKRNEKRPLPAAVVTPPAPGPGFMDVAETFDVDPRATYGQERLYDVDTLVPYGLTEVHERCLNARRDHATDHICESCGKAFGRVMSA